MGDSQQSNPSSTVPSVTTPTTAPANHVGDTLTGTNGATLEVSSYGKVQQPEQYGLTPPNTTAITVKGLRWDSLSIVQPLRLHSGNRR
jgi:hypothetical protein